MKIFFILGTVVECDVPNCIKSTPASLVTCVDSNINQSHTPLPPIVDQPADITNLSTVATDTQPVRAYVIFFSCKV